MSTSAKPSSHRVRWPRHRAVWLVAGLLFVAVGAPAFVAHVVLADESGIAVSVTGARAGTMVEADWQAFVRLHCGRRRSDPGDPARSS